MWLQHRAGCLGFGVIFVVLVAAIVIKGVQWHSAYAAYVGCATAPHGAVCDTATTTPSGAADFRGLGVALMALPLLVGVFAGAPLVAREFESGTFRFAWAQGVSRARLVMTALAFLATGSVLMGVFLGLLYGGWAAHFWDVALSPVFDQWQGILFATTWWLLSLWTVLGLVVGTLVGARLRRVVPTMAASAAVLGVLIVGTYLLLPDLLGIGASVRRLAAPIGVMSSGTMHLPSQGDWPFPTGTWVVRGWFAANRRGFFVSYQPPSHFWLAQAIEGVVVLAVIALCLVVTLRLVKGRAGT